MTPWGFEHVEKSAENTHIAESGGSKSGNKVSSGGVCLNGTAPDERAASADILIDPELAVVISAWPKLPQAIKAGVLALVKVTSANLST
jgi:hypothetical protein